MLKLIKTNKIWVDIDDVLSETIANFIPYLKEYHNVHLEYEDFKHFNFQKLEKFPNKNITLTETHDMWNEFSYSNHWKQMEVLYWSAEKLIELITAWFEIILITARWESLGLNTEEWLKYRFPWVKFSWIYFAWIFWWHSIKKSEICKKLDIEIMIEDSLENCLELAENGIKSYLIKKPWNEYFEINNPDIKRVNSWSEIVI